MEDRLLYRVTEVAVFINERRSKVYELLASGDLRSVKIDRTRLIAATSATRRAWPSPGRRCYLMVLGLVRTFDRPAVRLTVGDCPRSEGGGEVRRWIRVCGETGLAHRCLDRKACSMLVVRADHREVGVVLVR